MRITFRMCFEVMSASFDCAGFPKKRNPSSLSQIGTCAFWNGTERADGNHVFAQAEGVIVNTREQTVEVVLNQSVYMLRDGHQGAPIAHDETCRSV